MSSIVSISPSAEAGNIPAPNPIPVYLAPMSGLTDMPFRRLARRFGATMVVSEMVASERFVAGNEEEALKGSQDTDGAPYVVQLAGCQADWMAEAAVRAEAHGAAGIDINMGCPAKRVVGGYGGSALMKDLDQAVALIEAVLSSVSIPVSVKMRLGWDIQSRNAPELARRAQDLGVHLVAVHGRTRNQFYEGKADWHFVHRLVENVEIPVLVNGDIVDLASARQALACSGATGVMIGRAAIGNPWLLGEVAAGLNGRTFVAPTLSEIEDVIVEHLGLSIEIYGERKGVLKFRKHMAAYLSKLPIAQNRISDLCRVDDVATIAAGIAANLNDCKSSMAR